MTDKQRQEQGYVTKKDLKEWGDIMLGVPNQYPAKRVVVMREKPVLDVTLLPAEKPVYKPSTMRKPHIRTQNMETAVQVALGLVINLGMNISDMSSYAARGE